MKKVLFILSLIIIGCNQPTETIHSIEEEDCVHIDNPFAHDSILELADNIILHVENQKLDKASMSTEIENQKHEIEERNIHDKLTDEQIQFLKTKRRNYNIK